MAEWKWPEGYEDWTWGELEHYARTQLSPLEGIDPDLFGTVCHERDEAQANLLRWLEWSGGRYPDVSDGDVIAWEPDGTIMLDDDITTWNPLRALEAAEATCALFKEQASLCAHCTPERDHNGVLCRKCANKKLRELLAERYN